MGDDTKISEGFLALLDNINKKDVGHSSRDENKNTNRSRKTEAHGRKGTRGNRQNYGDDNKTRRGGFSQFRGGSSDGRSDRLGDQRFSNSNSNDSEIGCNAIPIHQARKINRCRERGFDHIESNSGIQPKNVDKTRRKMGYKRLEGLLESDPSVLLTTLASAKSGFQDLLDDRPIRPDLLILIFKVLNKVNEAEIHHLKTQILSVTFKPEFIDEIKRFLNLICIEESRQRLQHIEEFFENVLLIFEEIINLFPSLVNEKLKSVMVALNLSMRDVKDMQKIVIRDCLFERVKEITNQVNSYIDDKKKLELEQKQKNRKEINAPNNYRELPLIPTKDDFISEKAFLRENIVQGSYRDVDHYLDIQFRLLREDFIAPLRTGIYEYIDSLSTPHGKRRYTNVRIYPKVQFVKPSRSRDTFGFLINFDCNETLPRNINWEYNKRFMVKSLLLFSDNDFQTFYLATVVERKTELLQKRTLFVAFVPGTETPSYLFEPGVFFVMAESEVYYQAYRPVLAALQRLNENNFPMKRYIVEVDTECLPPLHVINKSLYNICGYELNLLDESTWPTHEQLKLNISQYKAFKSALINDFVVIQGPPGTGKTFLALKITEVFLKNKVTKSEIGDHTPIVVICYTNHALDQFLEGILKYTTKLIRIGGQSQNEALEKYNIQQIRKLNSTDKNRYVSDLTRTARREKMALLENLDSIKAKIEELSTPKGVLSLDLLKSVIPPHQYNGLVNRELEWLFCNDMSDVDRQEGELNVNAVEENKGNVHVMQVESADVFQNVQEFQDEEEEEMDDEENARRLADMIEDDYFEEDFLNKENYVTIRYSFHIERMENQLMEIERRIVDCDLPEYSGERFYFEREMNESMLEITWTINFVQRQFLRLNDFKFNPTKFEEQNKSDVWNMSVHDRWDYYYTWVHLYTCQLKQMIHYLTDSYQKLLMKLDELNQLDDLGLVRSADVIGLTTSGAAMRRVLLENLNAKIVIIEEAAEVLEAHIVTALTKSVEHVILIGDHKQLRPNPAVYVLAKKYNMDVSLFERMLRNGLGCSTLGVQHRMRPEIASLISPIYPTLLNHPTTLDRPKISGIDKFVFFLNHNHPEDQLPDSASRQNKYEANFLISLCQYLLLQGYQPEEITILTTYVGQVWCLKKEKRSLSSQTPEWKNIRITAVDNFQGEENRIILLSLVRSNKEARIGFLGIENRVCVALSRAKEGLYIIGNMDNLTASSSIWPKIKYQLDEINAVGAQLTLRCERHPDQVTLVSSAADFSAVPEGGCKRMCEGQLECGHRCPRICHIIDKNHEFYNCLKPCNRALCDVLGHKCPLQCFKPCKPCVIPVDKVLPCGHTKSLHCHVEPASIKCEVLVPDIHPDCNHPIRKLCWMPVESCKCPEPCPFRLPCGHACGRTCHVKNDPDHIEYKCWKDCNKVNANCRRNHPCQKRCYEVCGDCLEPVVTRLSCGHSEKIPCSHNESDIQCKKPCNKTLPCGHKCPLPCWLTCQPEECKERVDKQCEFGHTLKDMKCSDAPKTRKCTAKCTRLLACGHPCSTRCGDDCAKTVCQVKVMSTVAPACGHSRVLIPCYFNKPGLEPGSDELVRLCRAECREQLACGHVCTGQCGPCMQGRLHIPCTSKCNKLLICGHKCLADCRELCPPCRSKNCFTTCCHEKCDDRCNKSCKNCTKRCVWQCEHYRCTKQCGEECNRPVCEQPCTFVLKCGHQCIGYCGEVHPLQCRVCDVEDPVIAAHPTARFVVLEDCRHVISGDKLKELMAAATISSVVKLLHCPQCQAPIVKTMMCRSIYIHFRKQVVEMSQLVQDEIPRLRKIHARHISLFKSHPTLSPSMNKLLAECAELFRGNNQGDRGRLIVTCLLQPLVIKCRELKRNMVTADGLVQAHQLSAEGEMRLKLRLDYLAAVLQLRLKNISYEDIVQIELEVARVLRALSFIHLWFEVDKYTWTRDNNLMTNYKLEPIPKISSTLRTREATKQWYQCENKHLYVSENAEFCVTCRDEEEENNEKEKQRQREEESRINFQFNRRQSEIMHDIIQERARQPPRGMWRGGRRGGRNRGRWIRRN